MRPRVLILADVPNWAWGRKAAWYHHYLSDEFDICVGYHANYPPIDEFDLLHLFEFPQVSIVTETYRVRGHKVISGLTAHVWQTWGAERVQAWANRCDALHANSRLLERELQQFHRNIFYTPNGVDPVFWNRYESHPDQLVIGHVGKPNPRKGAQLIADAAALVNVPFHAIQRTHRIALSPEAMRMFYQSISLQVTASDMDGTPNPMLESAACENALLSTWIGNMPELIQWQPKPIGWLVDRSVDAIADRLAYAKEHYADVIEMGKAARQAIELDWTWERQTQYVRDMWRSVLNALPL